MNCLNIVRISALLIGWNLFLSGSRTYGLFFLILGRAPGTENRLQYLPPSPLPTGGLLKAGSAVGTVGPKNIFTFPVWTSEYSEQPQSAKNVILFLYKRKKFFSCYIFTLLCLHLAFNCCQVCMCLCGFFCKLDIGQQS